jgi:glycogen debranching enzyme
MDDAPTLTSPLDETHDDDNARLRQPALKDGDTFLVADDYGDILGGVDGLFDADTRLLSRLRLLIAGKRPSRLSSGVTSDNVLFVFNGANRPVPPTGGRQVPPGVLHVERRRLLWGGRLYERIRLINHNLDEVMVPVSLEFAADFCDMFEVRGMVRPKRGLMAQPELDGRRVAFAYHGLDDCTRRSVLAFSEPPYRLRPDRADFIAPMPPRTVFTLYLEVGPHCDDPPDRARFRAACAAARLAMRRRERIGARVRTSNRRFNRWIGQSRMDLALLTTQLPTGPYPYAGIPWFSTPFGRDGIISAWQMLLFHPDLARGVLAYLASRQATETNPFQDSQPGKIMHETRRGEMAAMREIPFGQYYGGVDTTPLFVALAGAYARRTGDLAFIRGIWPNLKAAVAWLDDYADSNADGLIDYARAASTGLANQGWKDSHDSIFHADGRFPKGPIALVEVQGYAFAAWRAMADLGALLGDRGAKGWAARAERIRGQVEERFWMEDVGYYGIAIDGEGALCRPLASNAGHLLFCGLPTPERARRVTEHLTSAKFDSGWGIRTLAHGQPRYNPMSYHNGSIWPHDNALCAAGMARYGERVRVAELLRGLFTSASLADMRLPELFCGFPRRPGEQAVPYPVACVPQAWAAGTALMVLQALLGIQVDAIAGEVRVTKPRLPDGVTSLMLTGLEVGGCSVDLNFETVRGSLVMVAASNCGDGLRVMVEA